MLKRGLEITTSSVAALEARLGAKLPEDYAEFLLDVNGGQPAPSHRVFTIRFRNGKTDDTALSSLYSLDDPDDRRDLVTSWERTRAWLPAEVLQVGYDGFGGAVVVVIAGPRRGQVWFLDGVEERPEGSNPRVEWFDRRQVAKVADSFRELMQGLRPLESAPPGNAGV
jgi:SMI1/KNR4 family protein SUKH-1